MMKQVCFWGCLGLLVIGPVLQPLRAAQPAEIAQLIQQLGAEDWQKREEAQRALEKLGAEAEEAVKQATQSADTEVRFRAVFSLKVIQVTKRVKFSEPFLKEFPDIYRNLALLDTKGKYDLFNRLVTDPAQLPLGPAAKPNPVQAKDNLTNQDLAGVLGEVLLTDGAELNTQEKSALLGNCFTRFNGDSIVPSVPVNIRKLLHDKDMFVRGYAANILGMMGDKEAVPEIKKVLEETKNEPSIHSEVVLALGTLEDKDVIPDLKKLLKDEQPWFRGSAAWLLGQFHEKDSLPEILAMVKENDWESRSGAIFALGKIGDKETVPLLTPLLKDPNQYIRGYTAIVLIELGAKDQVTKELAVDIKFVLAEEPHQDCRNRARAALKELGEKEK